jgi:UDP-N-acetylglucosamine 2-epimerase (non-hydrolysing)
MCDSKMKRILFVFGTRPEAVKMAPLILECKKRSNQFHVDVCVTGQHRQLLDQVLDFFNIKPDYDLQVMHSNQSLFDITVNILNGLQELFLKMEPDIIFVQGDTTSAFISALAAYYCYLPVVHIEAGLRSGNKRFPFPEEMNRILISHIAHYHFAPTEKARQNLYAEGIRENVWVVGNTVIDALLLGLSILKTTNADFTADFGSVDFEKRIILVTGHRRENIGGPFEEICVALREIARLHDNIEIVYPVHWNPNVREPVFRILGNLPSIHLIDPIDYPHLLWLMKKCYLVLSDSGGIQEEAPLLGKPVLVLRDTTERTEGIDAGAARLVGTDTKTIIEQVNTLLSDEREYRSMAEAKNPYGDGSTSKRIADILSLE